MTGKKGNAKRGRPKRQQQVGNSRKNDDQDNALAPNDGVESASLGTRDTQTTKELEGKGDPVVEGDEAKDGRLIQGEKTLINEGPEASQLDSTAEDRDIAHKPSVAATNGNELPASENCTAQLGTTIQDSTNDVVDLGKSDNENSSSCKDSELEVVPKTSSENDGNNLSSDKVVDNRERTEASQTFERVKEQQVDEATMSQTAAGPSETKHDQCSDTDNQAPDMDKPEAKVAQPDNCDRDQTADKTKEVSEAQQDMHGSQKEKAIDAAEDAKEEDFEGRAAVRSNDGKDDNEAVPLPSQKEKGDEIGKEKLEKASHGESPRANDKDEGLCDGQENPTSSNQKAEGAEESHDEKKEQENPIYDDQPGHLSNDAADEEEKGEGEEEAEEAWELIEISTIANVTAKRPRRCSTRGCSTPAACVYVSNFAPNSKWYTCLDCQLMDYGGWPDDPKEFPVPLSIEHQEVLAKHCSSCADKQAFLLPDTFFQPDAPVSKPDFTSPMAAAASNPVPVSTCAAEVRVETATSATTRTNDTLTAITPLPSSTTPLQKETAGPVAKAGHSSPLVDQDKTTNNEDTTKKDASAAGGNPSESGKDNMVSTTAPKLAANKKPLLTKQALEMHRKWQETAKSMGCTDPIIVRKEDAKKLIYDLLYDAFQPMNITQIHQKLKGAVPSPVLKSCLDDMTLAVHMDNSSTFADDSDDEDAGKKQKAVAAESDGNKNKSALSEDPFAGMLTFKSGKTSGTSLYYVDYSKAKTGNGLDRDARNELARKMAEVKAEADALNEELQQIEATTKKLLSEPTNEEATEQLEREELALAELKEKVNDSRQFAVNAKHKEKLKRRVESMATVWRKRRRLCMDFLIAMEENTEGSISVKKCLKGDGAIYIESDQEIANAALAAARERKRNKRAGANSARRLFHSAKKAKADSGSSDVLGNEDFVAVLLDSQGLVSRVIYGDEQGASA